MKYAENNRISHRQLYRQLILAFTASLLLVLTGRVHGLAGVIGICLSAVILSLYVFVLMRVSMGCTDTVRSAGKVAGRLVGLFFLAYILLTGGFLLNILAKILPLWLISGISVRWLVLLTVVVCAVGSHKGMQRRGRMAEVSGGIFLWVILLMMVLCLGQCKTEYFREMVRDEKILPGNVLSQTYYILCGFAGTGMLPFAAKEIEKRSSAGKTVVAGILTITGILAGMVLLIPAVLGWRRTGEEIYPVLPLVAGADLPGNVLARFDILWMGFLLYGILFALGSLFHYGHEIIARTHLGTGRYWMPAVVYVLAFMDIEEIYFRYVQYIFVPGMIMIHLLMLTGRKKIRRNTAVAGILVLCLILNGCAAIEPEKRMYPLAIGIQDNGENFKLSYGMPDLPQATGQEKPEEEGSFAVLSIEGRNFGEIEDIYNRSQEKYLDIGHVQVVIISEHILENGKWKEFLDYLKKEPLAGENIYVFRAEDPQNILNWDSGGTTAGEYLKGLLENRLPGDRKEGVTLRQVYYQWYRDETLPALPEIILKDGDLQVYL